MEVALSAPEGYSLVLAPVAEGWHMAPEGCRFWAERVRFLGGFASPANWESQCLVLSGP